MYHSAPSVRRALPPVGVQRTAEQLEHTTTVCEWLKTVVLQAHARCLSRDNAVGLRQALNCQRKATYMHVQMAYIWKQPWHFTSMKKLLGDWTSRLVLCFCFSRSAGGCSRSMSLDSTCMGIQLINTPCNAHHTAWHCCRTQPLAHRS